MGMIPDFVDTRSRYRRRQVLAFSCPDRRDGMKNQNRQSSGTDNSVDFVGTVPAALPDRYRRSIQTGGT
jgi:hypothetical protein